MAILGAEVLLLAPQFITRTSRSHDGAMVALADLCPRRYIIARRFFYRAIALPEITGDTSECMLYLCTEGIPQDETCPLGQCSSLVSAK